MENIRYVKEEDKSFWFNLDKHLSEAEFQKKIRDMKSSGYGMVMTSTQVDETAGNVFY